MTSSSEVIATAAIPPSFHNAAVAFLSSTCRRNMNSCQILHIDIDGKTLAGGPGNNCRKE
tara:strand:- start:641 stop:820 length:180 start_codon:yes stop_codon:yes gene_type:complete